MDTSDIPPIPVSRRLLEDMLAFMGGTEDGLAKRVIENRIRDALRAADEREGKKGKHA